MKKFNLLFAILLLAASIAYAAGGGADYGRGAETDPIASAAVSALTTNLAGANIKGNIPVAALTNAAASLGPNIGGNIPVAAITTAAGSVGPSIGGNIPLAALTNALSPVLYSGTVTNNPATTNVYVILNGSVVSVTHL